MIKDCRKCALAALAGFVAWNVLEFVVHGVVLMPAYQRHMSLWNPQDVMNARRWPALLAYVAFCMAFTRIYAQGYEREKGWAAQGLKCGLVFGTAVFGYLSSVEYMVYPVSAKLALAWFGLGLAESAILGLVVAAVYRPKPA